MRCWKCNLLQGEKGQIRARTRADCFTRMNRCHSNGTTAPLAGVFLSNYQFGHRVASGTQRYYLSEALCLVETKSSYGKTFLLTWYSKCMSASSISHVKRVHHLSSQNVKQVSQSVKRSLSAGRGKSGKVGIMRDKLVIPKLTSPKAWSFCNHACHRKQMSAPCKSACKC
jgi:hypothetical protein